MTTGLEESKVAVKWVGPWLGPPKGFTIEGAIEEVVELVKVVDVVFKNTRDMPSPATKLPYWRAAHGMNRETGFMIEIYAATTTDMEAFTVFERRMQSPSNAILEMSG